MWLAGWLMLKAALYLFTFNVLIFISAVTNLFSAFIQTGSFVSEQK